MGPVDPETVPVRSGRGGGRRRLEQRPSILYHRSGVRRLPLHFMRSGRAALLKTSNWCCRLRLGFGNRQAARGSRPIGILADNGIKSFNNLS
ncbi:hypothetical protein D9623_16295 [Azospirillum brasilense]|uniref:Uncharacterized protein n=1 Tax=Azospirillum brasilense TaxID=192 RepID=A0A4D8QKU3_AZOBR|nr:hypothetical protein D3868_14170 [Azospirillum brasilense]QEL91706.1 hypothetical protein D9621_16075 [Azospirillum brasilense]QEL98001.1 hypothetical protein D9623_16295 [Azospirillum brasilense]